MDSMAIITKWSLMMFPPLLASTLMAIIIEYQILEIIRDHRITIIGTEIGIGANKDRMYSSVLRINIRIFKEKNK